MALVKFKYKGKTVLCPKHDRVFKALFDDGKYVLLASFLSNILDMDIKAKELKVRNTEVPVENTDGKLVRLDFRITLANGNAVNVEMQVRDEHDMGRRSLYNLAKLMQDQLNINGEYKDICPVIAINILDFSYIKDSEDYINRYRMKNLKTNTEMPDAEAQEIIFIELPKLPKKAGNMKEWWLKFLAVKTEKELDMVAAQHPLFEEARDMLVKISADRALRDQLRVWEKAERDYNSSMARSKRLGMEKGMAKGRKEGRKEGKEEELVDVVKTMRANGFDGSFIAKAINHPLEQIEQILSKQV